MSAIKRRMRPLFILWTIFMWCMLMGEFTIGNLVAGLLVGLVICLSLPLPKLPAGDLHIHWGQLFMLLLRWNWDLFVASYQVAWTALRRQAPPTSAIFNVPMRVESELVFAIATGLYNLQPGGSVTDIDLANRTWTVHLLDASSQSKINKEMQTIAQLERRLIRIFERSLA